MRSFGHWTPRYIWNRLALMAVERRYPDAPWLTRQMIGILDTWLRPSDVGLEFGSGRSTVWIAKRVSQLTSVEHHAGWCDKVRRQLTEQHLGGVDYRLYEDGMEDRADSSYVNVTNAIESASLDFCLVDGVARDYCARACLPKLKPGGILIIDNVNWFIPRTPTFHAPNSRAGDDYASDTWREVGAVLSNWRCVWTSNGVTDTAFWVNPLG